MNKILERKLIFSQALICLKDGQNWFKIVKDIYSCHCRLLYLLIAEGGI